MKRILAGLSGCLVLIFLLAGCMRAPRVGAVPDFTFAHVSDIHISPHLDPPRKDETIFRAESVRSIPTRKPITLQPFHVTVQPVSFIVATGDLTEYGDPGFTWDDLLAPFRTLSVPLFVVPGNHDAAWVGMWDRIRERYGAMNYSFNLYGCHFIGLKSTSLQEGYPSLAEDAIEFVRADLSHVDRTTPVFVLLHHPPWADQFASEYEIDRLYDILHYHNVAAILYGHGHRVEHRVINGIDTLQGGQTYGDKAGFGVYAVKDGMFYAAHVLTRKKQTIAMLKKPLFSAAREYREITIREPHERRVVRGEAIAVRAHIDASHRRITEAWCTLDGGSEAAAQLAMADDAFAASIPTRELDAGAHALKIIFAADNGTTYSRSTCFYLEKEGIPKVRWRKFFPSGIKSTPVIVGEVAYFGANDGSLRAVDVKTGEVRWSFQTYGEIAARPLVYGDTIYFGSGDSYFYALSLDGKAKWALAAGAPVYCTAAADSGTIYFGTNGAHVYAVDAATGDIRWVFKDFSFNVESEIVISGDSLFFGAWDGYVYAVDKVTGRLKWRELTLKAREGIAMRYYSAADSPVVVASGKVFAADVGGYLGCYNAPDGSGATIVQKATEAISLSRDGTALYCGLEEAGLDKIALDGAQIWQCKEPTSVIPIPPVERDGAVYAIQDAGTVMALDAASGKVLWRYRATPGLRIMAGPAVGEDAVLVAGLDGSLTAIEIPPTGSRNSNN
jgi:outer membrane protein assembly factor BamB/Icc-related predicted phosphoesterase